MQFKSITAIIVLSLVVASLLVAGYITSTTNQTTTLSTAKKLPTYPNKRLSYGLFGRVSCDPGFPYGAKFLPTDGSGTTTYYDCNGHEAEYLTNRDGIQSNQIKYMVDNGWGMELGITSYMITSYPKELATLGAGHTQMDDFKNTYVTLMDKLGMKWWLECSNITNDQSILTYQTPGYDSSYYKPASGMATSYESSLGPALDFIEHNCSTNFQGYTFEQAYTNGVQWLHNRTRYCVSEKDWNAWGGANPNFPDKDDRGINELMGTNLNGTDITPMPTPLDRIGLLDELVIEIFDQEMFDNWSTFLPQVRATYPNLPIVLNVDQVCAGERWDHGPIEGGSDVGWWAPQGVGEPNNRCYTEQLGALQRIHRLYEINGKPFDGMIYTFYHPVYPVNGPTYPDITWFLQWADTLHVTS